LFIRYIFEKGSPFREKGSGCHTSSITWVELKFSQFILRANGRMVNILI